MKMNPAALGAVLMLFSGTVNANAGLVTYADFSLWSAAVSSYTSLAIPDPAGSDGYDDFGSGTASINYSGVLFATNAALGNGGFYNIGPTFSGSNGFFPVLSSQQQSEGVANILITLAAPVKAFALSFDTFFGSDVTFTLFQWRNADAAERGKRLRSQELFRRNRRHAVQNDFAHLVRPRVKSQCAEF